MKEEDCELVTITHERSHTNDSSDTGNTANTNNRADSATTGDGALAISAFISELDDNPNTIKEIVGNGLLVTHQQVRITVENDPEDDTVFLLTYDVVSFSKIDLEGERFPTRSNEKEVIRAFKAFHGALFPLSNPNIFKDQELLTADKVFDFITTQDQRLLPKCIFSLATGSLTYAKLIGTEKEEHHKPKILAPYLAT